MSDAGNAPSWLFSFVDLAFLLLIAMTQLADDSPGPDLGDIIVPKIEESALAPSNADADPPWQLRIHPPEEALAPFVLVKGEAQDDAEPTRLTLAELHARLARLKMTGDRKPLLAPHEDSRSQDLLDAVGALDAQWPGRRRAVVSPFVATR
ncbi:MAG: hypothetical protein ACQGVC_10000 [Myxococcota bacterium]